MLISRPFFYSGGIFVELAGGVRHSSDCCPERHEKPGCCRCPGTLKARCWQDASASACSASHMRLWKRAATSWPTASRSSQGMWLGMGG